MHCGCNRKSHEMQTRTQKLSRGSRLPPPNFLIANSLRDSSSVTEIAHDSESRTSFAKSYYACIQGTRPEEGPAIQGRIQVRKTPLKKFAL